MTTNNFITALNNSNYFNIKERSVNLYHYLIDKYAIDYFKNLKAKRLNSDVLQNYLLELSKNELSTNTIKIIWRLIKAAIKHNNINIDTSNVILPKTHEKKVEAFTIEEQKAIEAKLNVFVCTKHIGVLLALYLGLRLGEALALKWEDVNFENKTISIKRTVYAHNNILVYTSPKTKSSERVVPVPAQILKVLKRIKKDATGEFVVSQKGAPIVPRTYQHFFKSLQQKAKVVPKGFHSLRHTFATRALECGMDIKSLADIMGHKNPTVTLNRYAHSMMEYKQTLMNKIGKLYKMD